MVRITLVLAALACAVALCNSLHATAQDEAAAAQLQQAATAFRSGNHELAAKLATEAIDAAPKNSRAHYLRGAVYEAQRKHAAAVADFSKVIELDPSAAEAYNLRGAAQFKLGRTEESIGDFDRFIELRPEQEAGHWQRGISYYYAGEYEKGRKQFEGYQGVDDNDVENAVWRFLCMARDGGVEAARESILKIKDDRRVPMMQVYALFSGTGSPEEVLTAASAGEPDREDLNQRLFYAHLYLGLYHEAEGKPDLARDHILKAADSHKIEHYMWDVARVHADLLKAAD